VDGDRVSLARPPHDNAFDEDEEPTDREDKFGATVAGLARVLDVEVLDEGDVSFISNGRAAEKTRESDKHGKRLGQPPHTITLCLQKRIEGVVARHLYRHRLF
jgi:hypothetical protein